MELRKRCRLAAIGLKLAFRAPSSASFPLSGHSDSLRWVRAAQLRGEAVAVVQTLELKRVWAPWNPRRPCVLGCVALSLGIF